MTVPEATPATLNVVAIGAVRSIRIRRGCGYDMRAIGEYSRVNQRPSDVGSRTALGIGKCGAHIRTGISVGRIRRGTAIDRNSHTRDWRIIADSPTR